MKWTVSVLLLCSGCCMTPGFVDTQRAFFSVVEPEYRAYVEADVTLTDEQKRNRYDLLAAEEAALQQAEAAE
ncbi:MAG: hypothetical protein JSV86_05615 [Gemmatimonadota bacterium]|nr:MAG: hypothetical protein JSV86_05615 [Gemmatimonadota bacterium]